MDHGIKTLLSEVPIGERTSIVAIVGGSPDLKRRLMDMGLVRGAEILMIRNAPLRDPVEIEVKGTRLAIRRSEAAKVEVNLPAPRGSLETSRGSKA